MEARTETAENKQQVNINTTKLESQSRPKPALTVILKSLPKRGTRKTASDCPAVWCKTKNAADVYRTGRQGQKISLERNIEGMSYYNLGFTLEQSCSFLKQKFNIRPEPETLSEWISQYSQLCRYERLRPLL